MVMSARGRKVPRSFLRRALYSFVVIAAVVTVGTIGMHSLEGMSYLDSFYFTSMIATGQGPNYTPATVPGKIFAAVLAFVSVGTVIAALVFLFGPFFGAVLRSGVDKIEEEADRELKRS